MKILIICQYYYPEQFRVNDISFELNKKGHEVTVLTGLPNYPDGVVDKKYRCFKNRKQEVNGVKIVRSWLLGRGKGNKRLLTNYLSFAITSSLKSIFLKKEFDVILVYQLSPVTMALPGILLRKITRKPLIIYCHDLWPESIVSAGITTESRIYKLMLRISKWIYNQADYIFTSSKMFEDYFKEVLKIQKDIIHMPVYAESLFENIDTVNESKDDKINLLFAGNIGEMQSVETIIYAANELKNSTNIIFHIVGEGSSKEKCKELVKELGLKNIVFHGKHPLSAMPKFYDRADAFLVTLKANKVISYTLPNKVQSYMAAGKPIIGSIDGETQLVINEAECGYCSSAEDFSELAKNIKKFSQEKDKHSVYGRKAKEYYNNNFSKNKYMKKLSDMLNIVRENGDVKNV